jgi:hypothetical protein
MATDPVTFLIQIILPKAFQPQEAICLDNGKTKERLLIEIEEATNMEKWLLQVSRFPLASPKKWNVGNEIYQRKMYLTKELKFVAI